MSKCLCVSGGYTCMLVDTSNPVELSGFSVTLSAKLNVFLSFLIFIM